MPRPRKSKSNWQRRIERGLKRGLSRSQAAGRPKPGESYASGRPTIPTRDPKLEAALRKIRTSGQTLSEAATDAGVRREKLSRYIKSVAGANREGRTWHFHDRRIRAMEIVAEGEERPVRVRVEGFEAAHVAGLHMHEASLALKDQRFRDEFRRRWEGRSIRDVDGRWRVLSTDLNQIYEAILSHDYSFERFYRIE